jgi:hypothetical protein
MRSRPLAKLLLVLAPGTPSIDLLKGHTGTAVRSSSRLSIRPCWRCGPGSGWRCAGGQVCGRL